MTDKLPWLALKGIPGVGVVLFQRLRARFGQPAAAPSPQPFPPYQIFFHSGLNS